MFAVFIAFSVLLNGLHLHVKCYTKEPCATNKILEFMELRYKDSPKYDLCDRYSIPENGSWFRADGQDLATSPPLLNQTCGTHFSIWLNGSIPKSNHEIINATACVAGVQTICDQKIVVSIKNCGKYNVYFLKQPSACPVAYCFEFTSHGKPPTGKTGKPKVSAFLVNKQTGRLRNQELQFKCNFEALTIEYFYQIHWFIDGQASFLAPPRLYNSLNESTYLGEHERGESRGYTRLGIDVQCLVRLKTSEDGPPGPASEKSESLFAGIKVSKSVTVKRGEEGVIELKATVPFGCYLIGDVPVDCNLTIEMFVPRNSSKCTNDIKAKNSFFCAYQITNKEWNKTVKVKFEVGETGSYEINNPDGLRVGFKTQERKLMGNKHWGNYITDETHVQVKDEYEATWPGKHCYAHSDPHFMDFSGSKFDNHLPGTYIMYQGTNKKYITEVQIKVTRCNFRSRSKPRCVCAIGIRAGNDLFVIDRCPSRRLLIGFKSCGDNVLDARKITEFQYKVYFPTGMYVEILLDDNLFGERVKTMNVDIHPSLKNDNNINGLCGPMNKHKDVYYDRHMNSINKNNLPKFFDAWRVKPGDADLIGLTYIEAHKLNHWPKESVYCTCSADPKRISTKPAKLKECSSSNMVECSRDNNKKISKHRCYIRHERSAKSIFTYKPDNVLYQSDATRQHVQRVQRSIQDEQDEVWTMQKAKKYCESFMMKSVTFNVCKDIPNTRPDVSLENCALDIMLTNSTDWSDLTRRSMRMACMNEITYNNTLAEKRQNEAQSLAEKIRAISCPGDCSGHGICRKGQCACDVGFGAEDCSKDLSVPPLTYGVNVDDGGICDIAECPAAFVEGDGFLNSKDLKCKLQFFKANMNNSLTLLHHIVVNGEHDSLAEVHCPLPTIFKRSITYNDDSFVHGYLISISNNNRNYSSSHPLYFLDGRCQDTISIRGQLGFIVKDSYCYIGASCVANGTEKNNCEICDPRLNQVAWSSKPGCTRTRSKAYTLAEGVIASISVGSIIVVLAIGAGCCLYKNRPIHCRKNQRPKHPQITQVMPNAAYKT